MHWVKDQDKPVKVQYDSVTYQAPSFRAAPQCGAMHLMPCSDYMVLQDPYVFLKHPPFSNLQLLSVAELTCGMNGGFAYIQNTRPDGPVAWLYHRTTEVPLRWVQACGDCMPWRPCPANCRPLGTIVAQMCCSCKI